MRVLSRHLFPVLLEAMELLLNLAWLLLALPACWLWRSAASTPQQRRFSSLQCLLALAGVLVLLFPVISATDDLLAMRTEMEEYSPGKRTVRQAGADRCSACNSRFDGPPVLIAASVSFALENEHGILSHQETPFLPVGVSISTASRAPPSRVA